MLFRSLHSDNLAYASWSSDVPAWSLSSVQSIPAGFTKPDCWSYSTRQPLVVSVLSPISSVHPTTPIFCWFSSSVGLASCNRSKKETPMRVLLHLLSVLQLKQLFISTFLHTLALHPQPLSLPLGFILFILHVGLYLLRSRS